MRENYAMSEEQLEIVLEACKPVPLIMLQCGQPPSRQENANAAWKRLGDEMHFDYMTVKPDPKGQRFFTAVSTEDPERYD